MEFRLGKPVAHPRPVVVQAFQKSVGSLLEQRETPAAFSCLPPC